MASSGNGLFCFVHYGGENVIQPDGSLLYVGGLSDGFMVDSTITYEEFISKVCQVLGIVAEGKLFQYSVKFSKTHLLHIHNQRGIENMLKFNDNAAHLYVSNCGVEVGATEGIVCSRGSTSTVHVHDNGRVKSLALIESYAASEGGLIHEEGIESLTPADNTQQEVTPLACAMWDDILLGVGQRFESLDEFRHALYRYAIAKKFGYAIVYSNGTHTCYRCSFEGCIWRVTIGRDGNSESFSIRKFTNCHTHTAADLLTFKPTYKSKLMGDIFRAKIARQPTYAPPEIRKDSWADFAIPMTYKQAWRAKERARQAIEGKAEDSYKLIPWLCDRLIEAMPGTLALWECDEKGRFKQLFIAYDCSIKGFHNGCRPLIFIDGCHLSGPYMGTLLAASTVDANNGMYPIAYGVVTSENDADWLWFLENLKQVVRDKEVVIISDRNPCIRNGVDRIFGAENHAYCYRHLQENFSKFINNREFGFKSRAKKLAHNLLYDIAYARTIDAYNSKLERIRGFHPKLYEWVIDNTPEYWSIARFGKRRWDWLNSNIAECFNAWILEARCLQIPQLIELHRDKLAAMLLKKVDELSKWKNPVGPRINKQLQRNQQEGGALLAQQRSASVVEVKEPRGGKVVVDFEMKTCTCQEWQQNGIPCRHVCRACKVVDVDVYECVEVWYRRETQEKIYETLMGGVATNDMPHPRVIPTSVSESVPTSSASSVSGLIGLFPPKSKRPPGRPKRKRIESQFMNLKTVRCSRCKNHGHNRSSCREPLSS